MSILFLCRLVTEMRGMNRAGHGSGRPSHKHFGPLLVFGPFVFGVVAGALVFHLWPVPSAFSREWLRLSVMIAPSLLVLAAGCTAFGSFLIPLFSFSFGSAAELLAWQTAQDADGAFILFAVRASIAIPCFFLLSVLGAGNSALLRQALDLLGDGKRRELRGRLTFSLVLFAALLLCFFLSRHFLDRLF
ncbi:MAG: hypothetical protein IJI27_08315 [Oscillospiraceae bacterium]|nr:hypothetical protein [Oscillospiraceae bacterium]